MKLPTFSIRQLSPIVTFLRVALLMPECFTKPWLTSTFLLEGTKVYVAIEHHAVHVVGLEIFCSRID